MQDRVAGPPPIWTRWLKLVCLALMVFGLALVSAPETTRAGFSLLIYGDTTYIDAWDPGALAYIALVHAVLGAVLFGWGLTMWLLVRGPFSRGERWAWYAIALPLIGWFLPDTAYSLWSGFWQNAVFNTVFLLVFAIPLIASHPEFRAAGR